MAEIILYLDRDFGGHHTHMWGNVPDFTKVFVGGVGGGEMVNFSWNDQVSSIVVVSGNWKLFRDINYQIEYGNVIGPGLYPWVEDSPVNIDNDSLSSIQLVE